jgi:K+-sensing histidine kinase KdpD
VLAVRTERIDQLLAPAQRQLLTTFAGQIAMALERDSLSEQAHKILAQAQFGVPKRESSCLGARSCPPANPNPSPADGG